MDKTPIIQAIGLKKYFSVGNKMLHAVDDVNLSIAEGTTLGVVGESGCGKSTLGRTLVRLLDATDGQILYQGHDITKLKPKEMEKYRKNIQMIFQDPYSSLNPRQSISEAISMPMKLYKEFGSEKDIEKRTAELMDTVGLARRLVNAYPHELDGGRRQRVCIARALALNPKFIVCDEPVSALDVSIQAQILNLLMDLQRDTGLTYMFITHDLSVVKHISDEIMVMYMGTCVEKAPYAELFKNPLHPYTKGLLSAIPTPNINMRAKRAQVIRGEVTSPINPAPGCRFAARCEHCTEECLGRNLPLNEVSPGHFLACPYAEAKFKAGQE